jgi:hypothetical protein
MIRSVLACALLSVAFTAQAQKVYRCGPDGKVYSQAPCADGTVIDASDPRTAEQRAEARRAAAQERRAADAMERERLARERAPVAAAGNLGPPRPAAAASSPHAGKTARKKPKGKSSQNRDLVMVAPKPPKPAPDR